MAAELADADRPEKIEVSVFEGRDGGIGAAPGVTRGGNVVLRRRNELISTEHYSTAPLTTGAPAAAFAGALLGCLATLYLTAFGIIPAIASALAATLLCSQVLIPPTTRSFPREFFPAVYGGTFAGMTPVLWLSAIGADTIARATSAATNAHKNVLNFSAKSFMTSPLSLEKPRFGRGFRGCCAPETLL